MTGFIDPRKILPNSSMQSGDAVIMTKAIGTGVLTTAARADLLEPDQYASMIGSMTRLNKTAAEVMKQFPVNSCTDVTGFGLLGHTFEMANGSQKTVCLKADSIQLLPGAADYAKMGMIPAGAYRNREYLQELVEIGRNVSLDLEDLLYDPQTAGGLLISLPEKDAAKMLRELESAGETAQIIGWVEDFHECNLYVK